MALHGTYEPSPSEWVREQVAEYESSGGERGSTMNGDPIIVVTSVGARSGNLRKNPVMKVERDGIYVAVASKGGGPSHPEWYHNFVKSPEVEVQDGPEARPYRARLVEGPEREDYWRLAVDTWSTYADYQRKTDREIPVFVLEPAS